MQSVSDTVTIHVVDVAITEAPELAVGLPALGPGYFTVHAVGTPSPGFYVWTIRDHHIVEFPGGLDPENHAAPQFPATAAGTSGIDVAYTFMGVTVWDSLIVTWWPFAFRKRRSRHAPSTVHRPRRNSSCLRWASRREAHFCGKTETVRRSRPKAH
jgi:hypothetical protein